MELTANVLYILLGIATVALLVPFILSIRNTKKDADRWTPHDDAAPPQA